MEKTFLFLRNPAQNRQRQMDGGHIEQNGGIDKAMQDAGRMVRPPGRGLDFLRAVCQEISIPVYAIGGIDETNIASVFRAGAKCACSMSGFMHCEDAAAYIDTLKKGRETHAI